MTTPAAIITVELNILNPTTKFKIIKSKIAAIKPAIKKIFVNLLFVALISLASTLQGLLHSEQFCETIRPYLSLMLALSGSVNGK